MFIPIEQFLRQPVGERGEATFQFLPLGNKPSYRLAICDNFEDQEGSYETCQSFLESA